MVLKYIQSLIGQPVGGEVMYGQDSFENLFFLNMELIKLK